MSTKSASPAVCLSISLTCVRRSKGDSIANQVGYVRRELVINPRTKRRHNHTRKGGVIASGMANFPGTVLELVKAATDAETRDKAVEARQFILALPDQLTNEEHLDLIARCVAELVRKYKVACVWAYHEPDADGDPHNRHVHIIQTAREVGPDGNFGSKTRILDDRTTGPKEVSAFREWWCGEMNAALKAAGHEPNLEYRSFELLGIQSVPQKHQGPAKTTMARRRARTQQAMLESEPATPATSSPEMHPALPPLPIPSLPEAHPSLGH